MPDLQRFIPEGPALNRVIGVVDPYDMALDRELWRWMPDTVSLAGLQARAGIDAGLWDEQAMAEVAHRSLTDAEKNEHAIRKAMTAATSQTSAPRCSSSRLRSNARSSSEITRFKNGCSASEGAVTDRQF